VHYSLFRNRRTALSTLQTYNVALVRFLQTATLKQKSEVNAGAGDAEEAADRLEEAIGDTAKQKQFTKKHERNYAIGDYKIQRGGRRVLCIIPVLSR